MGNAAEGRKQGLLALVLAGPVLFPLALYDDVVLAGLLLACLLTDQHKLLDALHSRGLWLLFA